MANLVTKISTRNTGLSIETLEKVVEKYPKEKSTVLRVYGTLSSEDQKSGDNGPYMRYGGKFEALNTITGETYRSKTVLLPETGEIYFSGILADVKKDDPNAEVQVALDIKVERNASTKPNASKYKFVCEPLMNEKEDNLSKLAAALPPVKNKFQIEDKAGTAKGK